MDGLAGQKRASGADWHACDFRFASDIVGEARRRAQIEICKRERRGVEGKRTDVVEGLPQERQMERTMKTL